MPIDHIEDPDDPRLADYRSLNDGPARRRLEQPGPYTAGFFVAEGWLVLEQVLRTRHNIRSVLVAANRLDRLQELLATSATDPRVWVASAEVITAVVGFDLHRGVVASVERRAAADPATLAERSRHLLVIEGVNDGENLGVLFRNATGLGADGVLLDPTTCDPYARRTVRVSMGHVLHVPWARAETPWNLPGHRTVALSPSADSVDLAELSPDNQPIAVLVGAEGEGLSDDALVAADVRARIPMAEGVDSLNVASASAIAMWHLFQSSTVRR